MSNRGSASAIFTGLFDVGALIGSPALGAVISGVGYQEAFIVAAAWILLGGLVFAWWDGDLGGGRSREPRVV